ncbi:hypothetical protein J8244_09425 [Corynebacterium tuberculostearicum]|uniref:hypothetical protein n=1 Tax=Corynebacterium tuberculostearicum TaxID=38304 RepID=UPI002666C3F0|nr:hypothetical protein [Corynebacterium tuberculostearicum]WKE50341.1 hypothetical protein J8244_09425 [Corynebacterium tuberculostearicum]
MVKVTLAKHWSPENELYSPGDVVEVDDEKARWLDSCGAVSHAPDKAEKKPANRKPVDKPSTDDKPEGKPAKGDVSRPAKAASLDEWRKYAEAQGIVTKGLSKKDIIAATQ